MRSSLIILFLLITCSVFSQLVIPSERVQTHVNVRSEASSSSEVISSLEIGAHGVLLGTVPYYYHIRCNDSIVGYVSKAWTNLIDEILDIDTSDIVIGSWNIKWFGYYKEDKHDYSAMVDIIETFDVMAIQELRGNKFQDRLDSIIAELEHRGLHYQYVFSDLTGYDNNADQSKKNYLERYAYIWNINRIDILNPDTPYHFICEPPINNSHFRQVPIIADFKVKSTNAFDFKIVTVHTVYSDDINHVRASEISYLHKWLNTQVFDINAQEKDIFIIGDFNANPKRQPAHFDSITTDTAGYRIVFNEPVMAGDSSIRTTILVKSKVTEEDHLLPVYDHLLLSKHTTYAWPVYPFTWNSGFIGVVEFDREQQWQDLGNRNAVVRAMSDHRPIWIKLGYNTEDRD